MESVDYANKEIIIEGQWWLPAQPDEKLYGKLTGKQGEGFQLDLLGGWESFDKETEQVVIQGSDAKGKAITLLQCFATSFNANRELRFIPNKFYVHFAILGEHLNSPEEAYYEDVYCGLHLLERWDIVPRPKVRHHKNKKDFTATYKHYKPRLIWTSEDIEARLQIVGPCYTSSIEEGFTATYKNRLHLHNKNGLPFLGKGMPDKGVSFLHIIRQVGAFLSVAGMAASFPYAVEAYSSRNRRKLSGAKTYIESVEIIGAFLMPKKILEPKWHTFLFHWNDVVNDPQKHFSAWMDFCDKNPRSVNLFLSIIERQVNEYNESRFQHLVQSLEGLHRQQHPKKTGTAREKELQVRLKELFIGLPEKLKVFSGDRKITNHTLKKICDYRNDLAHSLNEQMISGNHLYTYCLFMEMILISYFLRAMAFDGTAVVSMISRYRNFHPIPYLLKGEQPPSLNDSIVNKNSTQGQDVHR